jgi:uncharacterized membrane protein YagU involved in acid resistance
MAELPAKIKCPGCGHINAKESFGYETLNAPIAPQRDPMTVAASNYYAAQQPPQQPVRVSTFEKVLNIEYQSTKSYAAYLWIMAIVVAIGVDGLAGVFILITSGKSFVASLGTVLGVHLIALPVIRVMLELVVNVERIAKR